MRITLDRLSKQYGSQIALDAVSLEVPAGQIIAVLGLNGAGKTTLMRGLSGLVAPDRGAVAYDGEPFHRDRLDLRRRLFFLPDFPSLFSEMTVLQHVGMCLRIYGSVKEGIESQVVEILRDLSLLPLAQMQVSQLSRGQIYKTALAGLLAIDPELWLLDEPFASGMDPGGITALKRRARDAASRGRTVLYTTQILEIAEGFSDAICILNRGRVRAFDSASALGGLPALESLFESLRGEEE